MKLSIIIMACLALAAAESFSERQGIKADKEFLAKEKFFLEILHNVHEPLNFPEYLKESKTLIRDQSAYESWDLVEDFFTYWDHQMFLPKGQVFSIFNDEHRDEVISLFNFFYYAKDWPTLYKNICWARVHINEGMFIYALTMTVIHHKELAGIVLPAPYEICPYMFFDSEVIHDAYEFKMTYLKDKTVLKQNYPINMWDEHFHYDHETKLDNEFFKDFDMWYVWGNYTQDRYNLNSESKLSYLREDIGLNSFYYYYNMDYPFWMDGDNFGLNKDHRGELFLHMHQQFLARYYLERLSQKMGEIEEFSYIAPIKYGYNPHMSYWNGKGFTVRKNYYEVYNTEEYSVIQKVLDYERRFREVVDFGYYTTVDGKKINLRVPEGVEYLGNLMQHNEDSVDTRFFGYWQILSHMLLGGSEGIYFKNEESIIPSVMEHFETALRDPVFYMLYKRLIKIYIDYQNYLPHYKQTELKFEGVEITKVDVSKIETYFEHFDADLTTLMGHDWMVTETDKVFKVRQYRLDYSPFTMKINAKSSKAQKVVVKTFLGPKYDEHGNLYTLSENRENFYQIDQFVYDLPAGESIIERSSEEFYWSVKDRTTWSELYKRVMLAIDGKMDFQLDMSEAHCGFPDRLIMPRGWVKGMPVQMFFMIAPYQEVKQYEGYNQRISCGIGSGHRFIDNRPFGYPFDREIETFEEFYVPNMEFHDVLIYHVDKTGHYNTPTY